MISVAKSWRPTPAVNVLDAPVEAVFLDRDGVINASRRDHVKRWSEFRFLPGAPEAIARLSQAGCRVFVITNQAVVNRGLVSQDAVEGLHGRMLRAVGRRGGRIEAVAYCPHRPDEACFCRKPRPGLLLRLARRFGVNLKRAVVIGDALSDIEAGQAVGCRTVLVLTGRGQEQFAQARSTGRRGFAVANDLNAAAGLVLARSTRADGLDARSEEIS